MPIEDDLLARELALVEKGEVDVELLRRFMQGGPNEIIQTEGGDLRSLLNLQTLFFTQFGNGAKQYQIPEKTDPTPSWQQIAVVTQSQGEVNPGQDTFLVIAGNEPTLNDATGGLQIVRLSARKGELTVQNLTDFTPAGQFGLVDEPVGAQLWLKSDGTRNRLFVTVLGGDGRITFDTDSQAVEPLGIVYVDPIQLWTTANLNPTTRADTDEIFSGLIQTIDELTTSITGES